MARIKWQLQRGQSCVAGILGDDVYTHRVLIDFQGAGLKNPIDPKVPITVSLTDRQVSRARSEAKRTGASISDIVRRWLDRIFDIEDREARR
jgi:hypothetical protein